MKAAFLHELPSIFARLQKFPIGIQESSGDDVQKIGDLSLFCFFSSCHLFVIIPSMRCLAGRVDILVAAVRTNCKPNVAADSDHICGYLKTWIMMEEPVLCHGPHFDIRA